ncbi:MAG: PAS domain S-box protein [Gemmatimonadota bacterium]
MGHLRSQLDETREREELTRVELDTVLENLSAGFYTLDQHGTIEYVNPRTAEILGKSREELVGRQAREVEPRPPGAEADGGIERALASREYSHYELKDESESGTTFRSILFPRDGAWPSTSPMSPSGSGCSTARTAPSRWRRWDVLPAASPTTSTTC